MIVRDEFMDRVTPVLIDETSLPFLPKRDPAVVLVFVTTTRLLLAALQGGRSCVAIDADADADAEPWLPWNVRTRPISHSGAPHPSITDTDAPEPSFTCGIPRLGLTEPTPRPPINPPTDASHEDLRYD